MANEGTINLSLISSVEIQNIINRLKPELQIMDDALASRAMDMIAAPPLQEYYVGPLLNDNMDEDDSAFEHHYASSPLLSSPPAPPSIQEDDACHHFSSEMVSE